MAKTKGNDVVKNNYLTYDEETNHPYLRSGLSGDEQAAAIRQLLEEVTKRFERQGQGGPRKQLTAEQGKLLKRVVSTEASLSKAEDTYREKQQKRKQALREANAAGISLNQLAESIGKSYQRVQQIITTDVPAKNVLDVALEIEIPEAVRQGTALFVAEGFDAKQAPRSLALLELVLTCLAAANVALTTSKSGQKPLHPRHVGTFLTDAEFRMLVIETGVYIPRASDAFDPDTGEWELRFSEKDRRHFAEPLIEIARKL